MKTSRPTPTAKASSPSLRKDAKDAALAAFAASKPGRSTSIQDRKIRQLEAENARLSEALKELAVEMALVRGKLRWA